MVIHSLMGLPAFAAYFAAAVALCILYLVVYTRVTPHQEYDLIIHEHNASAALALGLSLLGFAIALASAILHSANILDCIIWGLVALIVQIAAYYLARLAHPHISEAIRQNAMASGLWLGFVSIAAGILSAACMSP
jgi:putative membrane protein